jgi:hypothetical protein
MAVTIKRTSFWEVTPSLAYSSTLKMWAVGSSETSVNIHQTIRRHTEHSTFLEDTFFRVFSEDFGSPC